jgi:predicted phosphodiesterase
VRRFGLIGDVHAEDELLEAALSHLARERLDAILCAGDISDGRGDVDRCVDLLRRHKVIAVRGNHDRWCVAGEMRDWPGATSIDALSQETRSFLEQLPATQRLDTAAGPLLLAHGLGGHDMTRVTDRRGLEFHDLAEFGIDAGIRIHVGGHTHERWAERIGRLTMINAGTLKASDTPCFGILDVDAFVQWFDLDDTTVIEAERVVL